MQNYEIIALLAQADAAANPLPCARRFSSRTLAYNNVRGVAV
jgi:hypothetical protein